MYFCGNFSLSFLGLCMSSLIFSLCLSLSMSGLSGCNMIGSLDSLSYLSCQGLSLSLRNYFFFRL